MMQEETLDLWQAQDQPQATFDYATLDGETRAFVQQKAEETHTYLKRTAEDIVQVGQNLLAVKQRLGHGHFMAWLQAEFGMSYHTALNCIRVAERFGGKVRTVLTLPSKVLYLLAQPSTSETIIQQVENGVLPPNLEAIRAAREAERLAKAEAEQERRTASLWQEELEAMRARAQQEQTDLQKQIDTLHTAMKQRVEAQIQTKEVVPPAIQAQVEALQQKVTTLTQQRDALSKQAEVLGAQAREAAIHQDEEATRGRHMRLQWRTNAEEALQAISRLLIQWPTPLDAYHFEEGDWSKLAQIEEQMERLQQASLQLRQTVERTVIAQNEREHDACTPK
ncbi:hypothetical protein KSF_066730 [Reticulibacter mediterranei]|uniref:DUF3102 domain-containing protein n=1 Tax=Reticulibacter mediterranei TaxID=2778369 RepID=A0A8J3N5Q3_9CHLR|nr:DUF3102 domain-containing protein [Reticulibacter mediterranei]GHO96625.1 hypothetical protein KSF_066730 [Reticulibacter mediterranei]